MSNELVKINSVSRQFLAQKTMEVFDFLIEVFKVKSIEEFCRMAGETGTQYYSLRYCAVGKPKFEEIRLSPQFLLFMVINGVNPAFLIGTSKQMFVADPPAKLQPSIMDEIHNEYAKDKDVKSVMDFSKNKLGAHATVDENTVFVIMPNGESNNIYMASSIDELDLKDGDTVMKCAQHWTRKVKRTIELVDVK